MCNQFRYHCGQGIVTGQHDCPSKRSGSEKSVVREQWIPWLQVASELVTETSTTLRAPSLAIQANLQGFNVTSSVTSSRNRTMSKFCERHRCRTVSRGTQQPTTKFWPYLCGCLLWTVAKLRCSRRCTWRHLGRPDIPAWGSGLVLQ